MQEQKDRAMITFFELSQQYPAIAEAEVLSFFEKPDYEVKGKHLLLKKKLGKAKLDFLAKRLAYTKKIGVLLIQTKKTQLFPTLKRFSWKRVYKESISIKVRGVLHEQQEQIMSTMLNKLPKKKVDLEKAKTRLEVFEQGKQVWVTQVLKTVHHDFEKRKAHNRAAHHPSAMHPQVTRAMINLALQGKKKATITDPFVGTGGTLLEASDMGLQSEGFDIDPIMVRRAKANVMFFHANKTKVEKGDALRLEKPVAYVVADLPYGKGTKNITSTLYEEFLAHLKKMLKTRAVLCFKDNPKTIKYLKQHFKLKHTFIIPVHQSMQRRIVVIEQKT